MPHVTIHAAKTQLSRLIERVLAGEDIVIARGKLPVVRIVPVNEPPVGRKFGALKGRATVTDAFFEPLPDSELDVWNQRRWARHQSAVE
ncbi:MAG TPA: type II toxin-antitoxin system prevent-host-death family antitoxin [Gemmatimonadaceae bacterium]|nr:type II toxin-antitoxin system prevent-host-death family antitoxin [Gemmatimonadaceae bacterium]